MSQEPGTVITDIHSIEKYIYYGTLFAPKVTLGDFDKENVCTCRNIFRNPW